jgi:spermidine synthase
MLLVVCVLFFGSGISGLLYQVVWVRQFGQIFGNTVYSASMVVAIFMLGLGVGSYVLGAMADRRYPSSPGSLIRVYALLEALIALLGLLISLALPQLTAFASLASHYDAGPDGWQVQSLTSYVSRGAIAVVLLTPMTVLMGGTLTVLIRALVRANLRSSGWNVGLLYGANTIGAAVGAFVTDFMLVPRVGLLGTQIVAVGLNVLAAAGAFWLTQRMSTANGQPLDTAGAALRGSRRARRGGRAAPAVDIPAEPLAGYQRLFHPTSQACAAVAPVLARFARLRGTQRGRNSRNQPHGGPLSRPVYLMALVLAMSGFAALGIEMLWLRHLSVLLGGFRAVFSLLLTVMLAALGLGALVGGWLDRRFGRPARTLMIVQGVFAVTMLIGLASNDAGTLAADGAAIAATLGSLSPSSRLVTEIWFNLRPMLVEVALPSFAGGLAFPLATAVVQSAETFVGRRAGLLYAANTAGAVCGSLVAGFLLLPRLGMQSTAAVLAAIASLSMAPLYFLQEPGSHRRIALAGTALLAVGGLAIWFMLPSDFIVKRALGPNRAGERLVTVSEGATELLAVVERPGRGRGLLTNGHAMSSTAILDQRYMRALAHIPLLAMEQPGRVLVIGFGVGNTAHAASLHTSVTRVDVADLSPHILDHAAFFRDANHDVLQDGKVTVYVNDGRLHLQMTSPGAYDLITLEPPPVAHAGVAALYSREFYQLARSRLTPGGYVSQWLPAYQVPAESSLAMVRAFLDVFPQAVLLSGTQAELLLIGTTALQIELDPLRLAAALERERAVRADLERVDLGTVREIAGMFVGSAQTLAHATSGSPAVTDDRPLQEYGVRSGLSAGLMGVPSALFDVTSISAWCPRCVEEDGGAQTVPDLDLYLRLLQQAYVAPVADVAAAAEGRQRRILGSAYLGAAVPDSAEVHNLVGIAEMRAGRVDEAIREFRQALSKDPRSPNARANLGQILYDQGAVLLESRRYGDAAAPLQEAVELMPDSSEAHNDLGVALASLGRVEEAREHFQRAVALEPDFAEARRNLQSAQSLGGASSLVDDGSSSR